MVEIFKWKYCAVFFYGAVCFFPVSVLQADFFSFFVPRRSWKREDQFYLSLTLVSFQCIWMVWSGKMSVRLLICFTARSMAGLIPALFHPAFICSIHFNEATNVQYRLLRYHSVQENTKQTFYKKHHGGTSLSVGAPLNFNIKQFVFA